MFPIPSIITTVLRCVGEVVAMKNALILSITIIFILISCGQKTVTFTDPDKKPKTDDDAIVTDDDTTDDTTDDSPLTDDDDPPLTDNDSPLTDDDDPPLPDDDSPVTDNDEIPDDDEYPDEIGVDCEPDGEKKCNGPKTSILECAEGIWVTNQTCENNETCDDTREAILCAPHICVPATTYCKLGNVYTCDSDGLSEEMTEDCTATQYCDDSSAPNFPAICVDMVCTPDELYCDGNVLKECDGIGSGGTVEKDCNPDGVCDIGLENCVYTGELGGDTGATRSNTGRGNFFDCTKDVTIVEFSHRLNFTGDRDITFSIFEDANDNDTYQKIFSETSTINGDGDRFYSTGAISVNLVSGRKYIFATSWTGSVEMFGGGSHPVNVGFGESTKGIGTVDYSSEELVDPASTAAVFTQKFSYTE
jgi:hypothetical protein